MTLHGCGKNWGLATSGGNGHHAVLEMFSLSVVWRTFHAMPSHSTRVGLNQDLFTSGEDLAGIMDALRWKSPRMPLAYNRNLAAEHGAAGRLMAKIG